MGIEKTTELLLQAAGLEKQQWTFGFGHPVYKDANGTYLVDKDTKEVFFHYSHDKPLQNSLRYEGFR